MNPFIAIDVDDVLAAFTPHAHAFYGKELETCDYWCVKTMAGKFGEKWFTTGIAPVHRFWETLPVLSPASDIDFQIACYITSFPKEMYQQRMEWLDKHGFPDVPLMVSDNKLEMCKRLGVEVLIDDKPSTIQSLIGSPVKGIHFMPAYAGFAPVGDRVVRSLKEVKQYL